MNKLGDDIAVGVYRSFDNVENLKIRVCIWKTDPALISSRDSTGDLSSNFELLQLRGKNESCAAQYTFLWQEKVSGGEAKELSASSPKLSSKNGDSSGDQGVSQIRFFSYVDSEIRANSQEINSAIYCRCQKAENKKKATFTSTHNKTYQRPFILDAKDVVQASGSKHEFHIMGMSMAVMVSLGEESDSEEVQLCMLHYDSSGVLTVFPDLSCSPFFIRTIKSGTYECTLENVSTSLKNSDALKEKKFQKQVVQYHAETVKTAVGSVFDMPASKFILWYMTGELVFCKGFEAKDIFIHYTFLLKEGMVAVEEETLIGTTYTSRSKCVKDTREAHFGFPISVAVEIKQEHIKSSKENCRIQMLIEVLSQDSWGVCRHEGYGFCDLPFQAGSFTHDIKTWKMLPQSIFGMLKNFFIGGMLCFDDKSYMSIPKDMKENILNKYGAKTEASGSVLFKQHTLLQFGRSTSPDDFINKQQVTSNY